MSLRWRILATLGLAVALLSVAVNAGPRGTRRGNQSISTFAKSKRLIAKIFAQRRQTFYCGCNFDASGTVNWRGCGYKPRTNPKRARRMEVEHVVPAHAFGHGFAAWRDGHASCVHKGKRYKGRKCALKVSSEFRLMEADLFNLQPAVGEINGNRSNYSMDELPGEKRAYGRCDVEIRERKIEPRPKIRGDIARTYMYMNWAYPGRGIIGSKRAKLFKRWSAQDPVDRPERNRVRTIEKIQGNKNPFVP